MMEPGKIRIGTAVFLNVSFTDDAGVPVDPTTVVFKTCSPSGRIMTYTFGSNTEITNPAIGRFMAEIYPDEGGRWFTRWETTGNKMAVEDDFIVQVSPFIGNPVRDYA